MPVAPTLPAVKAYLGDDHSWSDDEVSAALAAETVAQARVVSFPAEDPLTPLPYPADLAEALYRRVARNLAMRAIPLGAQPTITEMGIGTFRPGQDPEVRRLEAPYRRLVVG